MNPDELLAQIADLLQQYLALGGDTPVAPEAQALMAAIQGAGGGQGAPDDPAAGGMPPDAGGGMPPDAGGGPPMPDEMPMPDIAGMSPDQMPTSSPGRSPLRGASDMALQDMKKKRARA
jgi:hypothetical protein